MTWQWWAVIGVLAGLSAGLIAARTTSTLRHRRPAEHGLPHHRTLPAWVVMLATGLSAALLAARLGGPAPFLAATWLAATYPLARLTCIDLDVRRLPDRDLGLLAAVTGVGVVAHLVASGQPWLPVVVAGIATLVGAWAMHWFSHGDLGFGDVKLVTVLAVLLAAHAPTLVLAALLVASLIAAGLMLVRRTNSLPFGPFLIAGAAIVAAVW